MSDDVSQRIFKVIAETQHIPVESVTIDSTFQDLNIDSLDGIKIVFALENEFDINVPDETLHALRNMRQTVEGVERLLAEKQTGSAA